MGSLKIFERYKVIFGYVGIILNITGIALMIPLLLIPFYKCEMKEILSFGGLAVITLLVGYFFRKNIKGIENKNINFKDSGIVVVLSWILSIVLGALPFVMNGQLNFTQAIFESVSGFTTTGLSVVDVTKSSEMILLWRSIMQFLGGIGLAVIMLSAIVGPLGMGLYNAEGRSEKIVPTIKASTKMILVIYCSYILGGIILYVICGMPLFDAINHSIGAVSTGGFSTKVESIGYYKSPAIELVTIILMILGTINFAAHAILWKGKIKEFFRIGEIKFMWILFSISIPLVFFVTTLKLFESLSKSIRVAIFEMVSAISTSGFSTVSYSNWNSFGIFMLIVVMIIGGGSGSTAGGVKQYRVMLLIKSVIWNIKEILLSKRSVKYNYVIKPEGKVSIEDSDIKEITIILSIYIIFFISFVFILLGYGYDIKSSLFEMASCLSTVGLSVGVTSPNAPKVVLWVMSLAMFLGRLEFLVVFYAGIKIYKDIKYGIKQKIKG